MWVLQDFKVWECLDATHLCSQSSTVLSLFIKGNKEFDSDSQIEKFMTLKTIKNHQGPACGHTHLTWCARPHPHMRIHPPTSGSAAWGQTRFWQKRITKVNSNLTSCGNISNPTGPPPSIKLVQPSLACKVWLNPKYRLNHHLQVLWNELTQTTALTLTCPMNIFEHFL